MPDRIVLGYAPRMGEYNPRKPLLQACSPAPWETGFFVFDGKIMIILRTIFLLLAITLLVGCTTGSALVTGTKRPAIDPMLVKIYRVPPSSEYEHIGIVKAESEELFSQQEALDRAVEELKKQAAKIGANGIILGGMSEKTESYGGYTAPIGGVGGSFYFGEDEYQTVHGDAIYVH